MIAAVLHQIDVHRMRLFEYISVEVFCAVYELELVTTNRDSMKKFLSLLFFSAFRTLFFVFPNLPRQVTLSFLTL